MLRALLIGLILLFIISGISVAQTNIYSIDGDEVTPLKEVQTGTNPFSPDTDNDGINDSAELGIGTNPTVPDTDSDGLIDGDEISEYHTDPNSGDTDGDGLDDASEINEYGTDPQSGDTDADGILDPVEVTETATDPTNSDTDADGLQDGVELNQYQTNPNVSDSDNDGLDDGEEVQQKTDPMQSDSDEDNLQDGVEVNRYGTDPLDPDSDNDTLYDGTEINELSTDPLTPDTDGDGLEDGIEYAEIGSDPTQIDTDNDGLKDGREANKSGPLGRAEPLRMDVFVELDYMRNERPNETAINIVIDAFAKAPIQNPDGSTGISLHVKVDDPLPREAEINPDDAVRLQATFFNHSRQGYHYAIAVHNAVGEEEDLGAFGRPTNFVFAIQTGAPHLPEDRDEFAVRTQAHLFMHELGHSIGLLPSDFDGIDSHRYTHSTYPSVMNYESPNEFVGYNTGEPFDDWAHIAQHLRTPNAAEAPTAV